VTQPKAKYIEYAKEQFTKVKKEKTAAPVTIKSEPSPQSTTTSSHPNATITDSKSMWKGYPGGTELGKENHDQNLLMQFPVPSRMRFEDERTKQNAKATADRFNLRYAIPPPIPASYPYNGKSRFLVASAVVSHHDQV
jgi:hypothetical protein